jgi:prevent-host-death family protein
MQPSPQVEPVSNLQRGAPAVLRKLADGPVFLAQRGRLAAAVVSIKDWDEMVNELARLRRMVEYDRQFAEARAGNYVDLDDLDKELAAMHAHSPD